MKLNGFSLKVIRASLLSFSGLLLEPRISEASFSNTDDECPDFIDLDYDIEFQGEYFSRLYVS